MNSESSGDSQDNLLHGFGRRSDATSVTPMNTSRVTSFGSSPGGRGPRTPDGQYPYPVDHSAPTYPGNIGHSTPVASSPPPAPGNIEPSAGCSHVGSSQAVAERGLKRSRQPSPTDSLPARTLRPRKEQAKCDASGYFVALDNPLLDEEESSSSDD